MKRVLCCLMAIVLLVGVLLGCAPSPSPSPAPSPTPSPAPSPGTETITLKMIQFTPEVTAEDFGLYSIQRRVQWESNGKIMLDYIGGPEAVPVNEQTEALKTGMVDVLMSFASAHTKDIPEVGMISISPTWPLAHPNTGQLPDEIRDHMRERYKSLNMYYWGLANHEGAIFHVYTRNEVETLDDLKGLKIACSGKIHPVFLERIGAVPVDMHAEEVYSAVETGVVDGYVRPRNIYRYGLQEVLRYMVVPEFKSGSNLLYWVNLDTWNGLSPELQEAMTRAMAGLEREAYVREKGLAQIEYDLLAGVMNVVEFKGAEREFYTSQYDEVQWDIIKAADPATYQKTFDMVERAKDAVEKAKIPGS